MPEEQNDELQDSDPAEQEAHETPESSITAEELEALRLKASKADEYKGFAARTAAENKRLKKQFQKPAEESDLSSHNESVSETSDERFERLELKTEGFSSTEVDQIMELGGRQALENPLLKEAIALQRKKAKSAQATPSGTAKSPVFKQYSEKDLKNLPIEEFEKLISQE